MTSTHRLVLDALEKTGPNIQKLLYSNKSTYDCRVQAFWLPSCSSVAGLMFKHARFALETFLDRLLDTIGSYSPLTFEVLSLCTPIA